MLKKFFMLTLICVAIYSEVFAATSVKVFTKDEAFSESNQIKPRIYIENTGDEAISNFTYEYSFTLNSSTTPIIEDYFTPNSAISLESNGGNSYTLVYDFSGETLEPGGSFPENSGSVVGIHFSDWSDISLSQSLSADFVENDDVKVYDENGNLINAPSGGFPIADAGADVIIYVDNANEATAISIDASKSYDPDGTIDSYKWYIGTSVILIGKHGIINLPVGERVITLEVTDNDGNVSTVEKNVSIIVGTEDNSAYNLDVYTKSFDLHEENVSKQRMYIQNNGENNLTDFSVRYYFNIRNSSVPVGEFWYTPKSEGTVVSLGDNNYYIELDYTGQTLLADGGKLPHAAGSVFAYHLPSWAYINYDNDYSFNSSTDFDLNENVTVHDKDGNVIYGNAPDYSEEALPNTYNFYVVNPVGFWTKCIVDNIDYDVESILNFYESNGNLLFTTPMQFHSSTQFNTYAIFTAHNTYTVELVIDGTINARSTFYVPAE